jgi:hypothetical protein
MNKSESIKELAGALAKAQAELKPAAMTATNPFLHNKYADLGSVIESARPVLAAHDLAVSQLVGGSDDISVTTLLMHASGEWIESTVSMKPGDEKGKSLAQVAGSIITYLRRYSLASILGMYADEDGDGNEPRKPAQAATPKPAAQAAPEPKPEAPGMTLDEARAVTNAKNIAYGEIDSETLAHMATSIAKALNGALSAADRADHNRKAQAIKLILADRGAK